MSIQTPMRRVVVTGIGLVTPLGIGVKHVWNSLIHGKSGISKLTDAYPGLYEDSPVKIAGIIPKSEKPSPGALCVDEWVQPGDKRTLSEASIYALSASLQAIQSADLGDLSTVNKDRFGVCIGSGLSSIDDITKNYKIFMESGYRKVSPMFIPKILSNMPAGNISIKLGLRGPNHSTSTACTTGAHSVGDAMRFIQYNDADIMLAGATEAPIHPLSIAGFNKPFDKQRSGFVMSEGAGVLVLEDLNHAKARGVKIYAEIVGYGLSGDANHITLPSYDGSGAKNSMTRALLNSNVKPEEIDYINAHATSTPAGDAVEMRAIEQIFNLEVAPGVNDTFIPKRIAVSSTKSSIGHLLGAAGAVEAIFATLSVYHNQIPPTINLNQLDRADHKPSPSENSTSDQDYEIKNSILSTDNLSSNRSTQYKTVMEYVSNTFIEREVNFALSNSFGFGGTNSSLIFKKYKP
ncbi:hypothetical protein BB560_003049 [Smittium megazygosporum]|uniref:3-oxoacyl-[acyl-carrier-protein] synthase n=1 Tax=Smittium megazygosporum TaxID=133381 RepID=A0A2T9ZD45_9FUNG|nr:hypothetical protein BB560_003049 [Smittium megazygosporum]